MAQQHIRQKKDILHSGAARNGLVAVFLRPFFSNCRLLGPLAVTRTIVDCHTAHRVLLLVFGGPWAVLVAMG